jgi:hypothetical protein
MTSIHAVRDINTARNIVNLTLLIAVKATGDQAISFLNGKEQNSSPELSFIKHYEAGCLTRVQSQCKLGQTENIEL